MHVHSHDDRDLTAAEIRESAASEPISAIMNREGYLPDADVIDELLGAAATQVHVDVLMATD